MTNGLNQYTQVSGQGYCYDKNGNLTLDGTNVYLYDVENRLVEMRAKANTSCASLAYTGQIKAKLRYDPMGRLHEVEGFNGGVSQGKQRFLHDGDALVAEYDAAGAMLKRYVHGPAAGADDPIAEYTGSSTAASARRNLYADARGSIVLSTTSSGATPQINTYDEYGIPGSANTGRFQYTGQVWLPELGMNYYKARMYSPLFGRFMQTDPIGYEDNVNLYSYVANDPINGVDPKGSECQMIDDKNLRCTMTFDKPLAKMDASERRQAETSVKAYAIAAAKAQIAAERGMQIQVNGEGNQPDFSVRASEIRDELFERPVHGTFNQDRPDALASNNPPWPLTMYASGLKQGLQQQAMTYLHEGIHRSQEEQNAYNSPIVVGRGHKAGYDKAARFLFENTPMISL